MKQNIEHFLFENIWNVVREIVPEEVPIKSIFSLQEVRTQKFEDLFPEVVLSTVAIISNKLAEQGLMLPLNNLCNMPLGEALEKSVYLSSYDLSTVPDDFISAHLVGGVFPVAEEVKADEVAFKPLKWSEANVVSASDLFYQKLEQLKEEYPDSFIFGQYQPWKKAIDKSGAFPKNDFIYGNASKIFQEFIQESGSAFEADFEELLSNNMSGYKAQLMQNTLERSSGELGVGINRGISIWANLQPLDLENDYSLEEVEEVLNLNLLSSNVSWLADTSDLILQATAKNTDGSYYNAKLKGDFFVFPNSDDLLCLDANEPFYIIQLNRLDETDRNSLLAAILNR